MKFIYSFIVSSITLFTFVGGSCRKGGKCESPININQSEIVAVFKDSASGNYLYAESNPLYSKDSLKVFDSNGNSLVILKVLSVETIPPFNQYWILSFGNIYNQQTDANAFDTEICKDFIVRYKYNEFDIVKACFKAKKTECGSVFETLKVFHEGKLLTTAYNDAAAYITLTKN